MLKEKEIKQFGEYRTRRLCLRRGVLWNDECRSMNDEFCVACGVDFTGETFRVLKKKGFKLSSLKYIIKTISPGL